MLSNLEQESDHREALDAGAIAFIIKSNVRLDRLAAEVDAIFASQKSASV
jgi:DNA-binding NarL/FixJ family response regulator